MTRPLTLLIALIFCLLFSCEKVKTKDSTIYVYTFKDTNDYSNHVPVELSKDKSKITSAPGSLPSKWPVELISGYYLNGSLGPNTGYISMTIDEYNSYEIKPSVDTLSKLIIEKDPYSQFYRRNDDNNKFYNENGAYGIDTALINDLIRKNSLEKYFERVK